ncbi:Ankyrin repeat domain-containing protein 11 [Trichoplax sp. H2]|nr:Ankyrin repeat domain-containing protein 11 [Trichoplax sp. H2]|eukprot:RDD47195.1 Ankyrin repeat domain-containing protein 11 [Trichoplax sp. H2]
MPASSSNWRHHRSITTRNKSQEDSNKRYSHRHKVDMTQQRNRSSTIGNGGSHRRTSISRSTASTPSQRKSVNGDNRKTPRGNHGLSSSSKTAKRKLFSPNHRGNSPVEKHRNGTPAKRSRRLDSTNINDNNNNTSNGKASSTSVRRFNMPYTERQQMAMLLQMSAAEAVKNEDVDEEASPIRSNPNTPTSSISNNGGSSSANNANVSVSASVSGGNSNGNSRHRSGHRLRKRNERGETMLHAAAIKGDTRQARELIEEGADVNARDNAGWTPLHEACIRGHHELVKILLEAGADINAQGLDQDSPLHDAVSNDHQEVVKLLIKFNANINQSNAKGVTPLKIAQDKGMTSLLRVNDNEIEVLNDDKEQNQFSGVDSSSDSDNSDTEKSPTKELISESDENLLEPDKGSPVSDCSKSLESNDDLLLEKNDSIEFKNNIQIVTDSDDIAVLIEDGAKSTFQLVCNNDVSLENDGSVETMDESVPSHDDDNDSIKSHASSTSQVIVDGDGNEEMQKDVADSDILIQDEDNVSKCEEEMTVAPPTESDEPDVSDFLAMKVAQGDVTEKDSIIVATDAEEIKNETDINFDVAVKAEDTNYDEAAQSKVISSFKKLYKGFSKSMDPSTRYLTWQQVIDLKRKLFYTGPVARPPQYHLYKTSKTSISPEVQQPNVTNIDDIMIPAIIQDLPSPLISLYRRQEIARRELERRHDIEIDRLRRHAEYEITRTYQRASLHQQEPISICCMLMAREVPHVVVKKCSNCKNDRSYAFIPSVSNNVSKTYYGILLKQKAQLQQKHNDMKEETLSRHRNERDTLLCLQRMEWSTCLRDNGLQGKISADSSHMLVPAANVAYNLSIP